jgi:hypothetical protein
MALATLSTAWCSFESAAWTRKSNLLRKSTARVVMLDGNDYHGKRCRLFEFLFNVSDCVAKCRSPIWKKSFRLFHIDLGLGDIKITFEDLISAFAGSLLCIIVWRLIRRNAGEKEPNAEL